MSTNTKVQSLDQNYPQVQCYFGITISFKQYEREWTRICGAFLNRLFMYCLGDPIITNGSYHILYLYQVRTWISYVICGDVFLCSVSLCLAEVNKSKYILFTTWKSHRRLKIYILKTMQWNNLNLKYMYCKFFNNYENFNVGMIYHEINFTD